MVDNNNNNPPTTHNNDTLDDLVFEDVSFQKPELNIEFKEFRQYWSDNYLSETGQAPDRILIHATFNGEDVWFREKYEGGGFNKLLVRNADNSIGSQLINNQMEPGDYDTLIDAIKNGDNSDWNWVYDQITSAAQAEISNDVGNKLATHNPELHNKAMDLDAKLDTASELLSDNNVSIIDDGFSSRVIDADFEDVERVDAKTAIAIARELVPVNGVHIEAKTDKSRRELIKRIGTAKYSAFLDSMGDDISEKLFHKLPQRWNLMMKDGSKLVERGFKTVMVNPTSETIDAYAKIAAEKGVKSVVVNTRDKELAAQIVAQLKERGISARTHTEFKRDKAKNSKMRRGLDNSPTPS